VSKERERYKRNRERVYEIYKIPKKDRGTKYNIHHIVQRADKKNGNFDWYDIDGKGNLYPLKKEVQFIKSYIEELRKWKKIDNFGTKVPMLNTIRGTKVPLN